MKIEKTKQNIEVSKTEYLYVCLYFFGLFGVYSTIKISPGGSSISQYVFPLLYIINIYLIIKLKYRKNIVEVLNLSLFLFFGIFISSLLSYNPSKSLLSVLQLIFNFVFAYWLYNKFEINYLLKLILNVLVFSLVISLILILIEPSYVLYFDPMERESLLGLPNFKAIFPHKIHAGIFYNVGFYISFYFSKELKSYKYKIYSFLFLVGILGSGSSLAFAIFAFTFIISKVLFIIYNKIGEYGFVVILLIFLIGIYVVNYLNIPSMVLEALGRDSTLTGRTIIWDFGIKYISENPIIGGGFNIFFDESRMAPAQKLWSTSAYYQAPSFHNGYIEILAEAGMLGTFAFIYILLITTHRSIKLNNELIFSLMIVCIIANTAAAFLIKPNIFFFTMLIYLKLIYIKKTKLKRLKNFY